MVIHSRLDAERTAQHMAKCRITVLKRTMHRDLAQAYLTPEAAERIEPCNCFRQGQQFVQDESLQPPVGFCTWAWADIRCNVMTILCGGDWPDTRSGLCITCCSDGIRPVIFKLERIE
jgi:uncharacterized repeat protein (TIGR04076 family)